MILFVEQVYLIANFAFVRCIMKSMFGYSCLCMHMFAVRSVAFLGTFESVNVSLFCGAGRHF